MGNGEVRLGRLALETNDAMKESRRGFLRTAGAAAVTVALSALPLSARAQSSAGKNLKIGIVGSGRIGGTLGELWVKAGHEVMFSSLDLEHDKALAARLVRAFNSVGYSSLRSEAHRAGERIAIPLAADDKGALEVAMRLVQEAGFEPVVVGPLARAREFDVGTPVFGKALTARELRLGLGIGSGR